MIPANYIIADLQEEETMEEDDSMKTGDTSSENAGVKVDLRHNFLAWQVSPHIGHVLLLYIYIHHALIDFMSECGYSTK